MQSLNELQSNYLITGIGIVVFIFVIAYFILKKLGKNPKNILPENIANRIHIPLFVFLITLFLETAILSGLFDETGTKKFLSSVVTIGIIFSVTWFLIVAIKIAKLQMLKKYDFSTEDNLKARKVYTQFLVLENIVIFIIVLLALGVALMSFESIRSIGVSVLTSAGIAGIIVGFSAQKAIGTLLAGIQIAITQPIRLDDVVIVEGEWGRIDEITLTYVVVKIWDKRRLVVPSTYFIENPFQNWTRESSDILGTVFIYTDYEVPFDKLREELTRLLESTPLWNGDVNVLQVTDATERTVQIRALMSAKDSPTAWDLRVFVREKLLVFLKENYPDSLPKTRIRIYDTEKEIKSP